MGKGLIGPGIIGALVLAHILVTGRLHLLLRCGLLTGIVIFAIGFEAPSGGQNLMRACASSDSHYFDVDGVEISEAFSAIARTINQLRLTQ